jgi:hypothetical protein
MLLDNYLDTAKDVAERKPLTIIDAVIERGAIEKRAAEFEKRASAARARGHFLTASYFEKLAEEERKGRGKYLATTLFGATLLGAKACSPSGDVNAAIRPQHPQIRSAPKKPYIPGPSTPGFDVTEAGLQIMSESERRRKEREDEEAAKKTRRKVNIE